MMKHGSPKQRLSYSWGHVVALVGVFLLFHPSGSAMGDTSAREEALKAAFVYNFAKFTSWPADSFADPSSPLVFCFHRGSLGRPALETLRGKMVRNRPIRVNVIHGSQNLNPCHVIYLGRGTPSSFVGAAVKAVAGAPTLLVSDLPRFVRQGGHIGLVRQGNRLRFEINLGTAARSRLSFSSKLLQLAIIIDADQ